MHHSRCAYFEKRRHRESVNKTLGKMVGDRMRIVRLPFLLIGIIIGTAVSQDRTPSSDPEIQAPSTKTHHKAKSQTQSKPTVVTFSQGRWQGTTLEGDSLEFNIKGRQLAGPFVVEFSTPSAQNLSSQSARDADAKTRLVLKIPGADLAKGAFDIVLPGWDITINVRGIVTANSAKGTIEFAQGGNVTRRVWTAKLVNTESSADTKPDVPITK